MLEEDSFHLIIVAPRRGEFHFVHEIRRMPHQRLKKGVLGLFMPYSNAAYGFLPMPDNKFGTESCKKAADQAIPSPLRRDRNGD
jgi:hypothetical protein